MWSRGDAPARRDDDGIELARETAEAGWGLDGSALCIKVAIERSASGRRMSTLKILVSGKPEVNIFPDAKAPSGCRRVGDA